MGEKRVREYDINRRNGIIWSSESVLLLFVSSIKNQRFHVTRLLNSLKLLIEGYKLNPSQYIIKILEG